MGSTDMGRGFILCCSLLALAAGERTYHGYTVLRTEKLDAATSQMVFNELAEVEGLSFWKDPAPGRQTDIMAAPHMKTRLEAWLKEQGIKHAPMVHDVQSLIEETRPFQCLATVSTPTPSCGCGLTAMLTTPTPRTEPRSSSWPSMPATPSSRFTAPSLTQSTQPTYTLLLEPLTTGTREFWAPGLHLPLNCVTLAPTGLSCQRSKSSQAGRRCGLALRSSSTESLRRRPPQLHRLLNLDVPFLIKNKVEDNQKKKKKKWKEKKKKKKKKKKK